MFFTAVGVGAVIGFIYDLFRILRKTAPHAGIAVQFEDMIFWLGVTLFMFYFLLMKSNGEMRWFSLLGAALGAVLYFAALSRWVMKVSVAVIEAVKKIIAAAVNIILFPIKKLVRLLKKPLKKVARSARKNLRGAAAYGKMKLKKTAGQIRIVLKKV